MIWPGLPPPPNHEALALAPSGRNPDGGYSDAHDARHAAQPRRVPQLPPPVAAQGLAGGGRARGAGDHPPAGQGRGAGRRGPASGAAAQRRRIVPAAGGEPARGVGRTPARPTRVVTAGRARRPRLAPPRPARWCWPARAAQFTSGGHEGESANSRVATRALRTSALAAPPARLGDTLVLGQARFSGLAIKTLRAAVR